MIIIQLDHPGQCYRVDLDINEVALIRAAQWQDVARQLHESTIVTISEDAPPTAQGDYPLRLVILLYDDESGIGTGYLLDNGGPRHYFSQQSPPILDLEDVTPAQALGIGAQWAREMGAGQILLYRPDRHPHPLKVFDTRDILAEMAGPLPDLLEAEY